MKTGNSLMVLALMARLGSAQGTITTVAGGSGYLDNVPAVQARLDGPRGIAVDPQGNAWFGDGRRIRRVDASTGVIATVAGTGGRGSSMDGTATQVNLDAPTLFTLDPAGSLYFVDTARLMKYDPVAGTVTTLAGGYALTTPQWGIIAGLATDRAGNLFVSDDYYGKIYRMDAVTKAVTRIAGIGPGPAGDGGPATQASLGRPGAITVDGNGNIFILEQYALRRIDGQSGIITTVMPVDNFGSGDGGPVSKASLKSPAALAADGKGNLYIVDSRKIRKIDWSTGIIATVAGTGLAPYAGDGAPALQSNFGFTRGIAIDAGGNLWYPDEENARLLKIVAATGKVLTVAGTSQNGDGGPAAGALLPYPTGVAANEQGDLFILQSVFDKLSLRRIDHLTGVISTVATATTTLVGQVALDAAGNAFFTSTGRVNRVDALSGKVSTVAGNGFASYSGDGGLATSASIAAVAVAVDRSGNLFIADYANYIRRVDAQTGIITTIAGNGKSAGQLYTGASGKATEIAIGYPYAIAVSPAGETHWVTSNRVVKIDANGLLSVVVGNGACDYTGDGGPATLASVCAFGLAFDDAGNLFVGDGYSGTVRRVDAATGLIQTVAGNGTRGPSADGIPATQAALNLVGLATAGTRLYLLNRANEETNGTVRMVSPAAPPPMPQPPKITRVTNGIDFRNSYSPGAIVSVLGNYLASPTPVGAVIGSDGRFGTALDGDTVTWGGTAAPLLYVSAGQINAVAPYSVRSGNTAVPVQVRTGSGATDTINVQVSATSLAVFPGLIFNPDGTLNGATNPAPKGSTLVLYGTGMGQTTPAGIDGAVLQGPDFPHPVAQFLASVQNGASFLTAEIVYLGPLPGFISGTMQVNVRIPDNTPPGQSTLRLNPAGGGLGIQEQTIYMLSDPPVLSSMTPASPIPQTIGLGVLLELTGSSLNRITAVNFYQGGKRVDIYRDYMVCSATACSVLVDFAGRAGEFSVEVVNVTQQVSNRLAFTVQPVGGPTVTYVGQPFGTANVVAFKGIQNFRINGTNFQTPLSVEFYYNGNRVGTVTSQDALPVQVSPTVLQMFFDFQGNAGQYGVEVVTPAGRSERFAFAVVSP